MTIERGEDSFDLLLVLTHQHGAQDTPLRDTLRRSFLSPIRCGNCWKFLVEFHRGTGKTALNECEHESVPIASVIYPIPFPDRSDAAASQSIGRDFQLLLFFIKPQPLPSINQRLPAGEWGNINCMCQKQVASHQCKIYPPEWSFSEGHLTEKLAGCRFLRASKKAG
jgi:hypothetical protein